MTGKAKGKIFVVDDDPCILDTVCLRLKRSEFACCCFDNADDCIASLDGRNCDLIITDVRMPDKSGLELLDEVKRKAPWVPVIMMTSYGDVPLAVKAVKAGAVDLVEKPLEWEEFLTLIQTILALNDLDNLLRGKPLTKTEKIILHLILQDKTNKEIANILHRSVRTVEVHRSHIMHKLDVDSIVDLVRRASAMDLEGGE